jgi:hypothetical protein
VLYRKPTLASVFESTVHEAAALNEKLPRDPAYAHNNPVMALVCGPKPLIDDVSELCFTHGCTFHAEEFHF